MKRRIWFPAKRYGWGWGLPTCWQGWAVLAAYIASLIPCVLFLREHHHALYVGSIVGLSGLLTAICWMKGEKPGWRWGGRDN